MSDGTAFLSSFLLVGALSLAAGFIAPARWATGASFMALAFGEAALVLAVMTGAL